MSSTPEFPEVDLDVVSDPVPAASDAQGAEVIADAASDVAADTAPEVVPDPALIDAPDLALAALREITAESTIGEPAGYRVESDGVVSLRFENLLAGYPGWYWTVSVARVDGEEPTVLEAELLPGDGALLAPDWVPWAVRLAEYQASQAALAEAGVEVDEEDADLVAEIVEELSDVEDLDAADFDDDGSPILHAGDVDGVDIDELLDAVNEDEFGDDDFDDEDSDDEDDLDEESDEDDSDEDDSDDDDSDEDDSFDDQDDSEDLEDDDLDSDDLDSDEDEDDERD